MKYYYITNNPNVAKICDDNGVIPWIDLETLGKEERQKGKKEALTKKSSSDNSCQLLIPNACFRKILQNCYNSFCNWPVQILK